MRIVGKFLYNFCMAGLANFNTDLIVSLACVLLNFIFLPAFPCRSGAAWTLSRL
jgi:hypothetical protein